jgi:hypothetical protein
MRLLKKKNAAWLSLTLIAIMAVVAGFFIPSAEGEHEFWWSNLPIFFALLGFIGCVAMIYIAKWLGHYWLQRKEDYYD